MRYFLLKSVWKLLSMIPLPVMYVLADGLYYPFYYLIRYRRKIVRRNLTESFPQKNMDEIKKIEKSFYRFFLDIFFETCKFATVSEKEIRRRMKFVNPEAVNQPFIENKPVSLYLGHFGNWEWISSMPLHLKDGFISGQIYQKLRNKTVDRLMYEDRIRFGATNIEMRETVRWISEKIKNQDITIVGYIADQSPRKKQLKHYLDFLEHQAPVLTGTEKIAKKYGMDVFYVDVKRIKRGYYEASFVKMHENPQLLPDFELTEIFFNLLEESIHKHPELYLWTHNRFKHAKNNTQ